MVPQVIEILRQFPLLNQNIETTNAISIVLTSTSLLLPQLLSYFESTTKKKSFQLGWEGKLATERTTLRRRHQGLQAYPILFSLPSFLRYNSSNSGFNSLITLLFDYSFSYSD